jgi:hypothetical protein
MRQCRRDATKLDAYTDTRDLQRELKTQGVQLTTEADEKSKGAGVFCHWTLTEIQFWWISR